MKQSNSIYVTLGLFFIWISCNTSTENKIASRTEVNLVPSGQIKKISLDDNTSIDCLSMFYYRDEETKKEYLTYLNSYKNEIQFYDLKSQKLEKKVLIAKDGPNGIGKVSGFKVVTQDSIFITTGSYTIYLVNVKGEIINKFSYKKTLNGSFPSQYMSTSRIYRPLVIKHEKLYIPQMLIFEESYLPKVQNSPSANSQICLVVDKNGKNEYLPMKHPLAKEVGLSYIHFSREFDGNNFVYSFFSDPYIYVTKDHIQVDKYYAPSRYIKEIKYVKYKSMPSIEKLSRDFAESSSYHNLVYDSYRKLYYRFVKLSDNYEKGDDLKRLVKYSQNFSIIILNKDFKVIGESKLPSKTYEYTNFFVAEDGLYLSINHIDNPNLNIDHLQFELIKVQHNEK